MAFKKFHWMPLAAVAIALALMLSGCAGNRNIGKATEAMPTDTREELSDEHNQANAEENQMLKIQIEDHVLYAEFEANSSAETLKQKLAEQPLTLEMHDYGNFEKVGDLPWSLPRNDTQITTQPGDVILYLGNELTIYYDTNSWNFTRVARIQDTDEEALKKILGTGNVTAVFSVEDRFPRLSNRKR